MSNYRHRGRITPPMLEFYKRRIDELCKMFPVVFNKKLPLPLEIGTHKNLLRFTSFTEKEIGVLLAVWTRRFEYRCAAVSLGHRFNLLGEKVNAISEEQMPGFIKETSSLSKSKLETFCKNYLKLTGQVPLIFLPIKDRPEISI